MVKEPWRSLLWFWGGVLVLCIAMMIYANAQERRTTLSFWESLRVSPPCTITDVSGDKLTIATAEGKRVWVKVLDLTVETTVFDRLGQKIAPVSQKFLKEKQLVVVIYHEQEAIEVHVWK